MKGGRKYPSTAAIERKTERKRSRNEEGEMEIRKEERGGGRGREIERSREVTYTYQCHLLLYKNNRYLFGYFKMAAPY